MSWLVFVLAGKLLIFLGQRFPLPERLERYKNIKKLHECPLCLGVWIYGLLAYFLHMDILGIFNFSYVPFLSELITGGAVSFVVYIFSVGWSDVFAPNIVI